MKKDKQSSANKSIDQFEFHILPISISSPKPPNASFFIYVEKGNLSLNNQELKSLAKSINPLIPLPKNSYSIKTISNGSE